jgi:hypothetical protein
VSLTALGKPPERLKKVDTVESISAAAISGDFQPGSFP